MRTVAMEQYAAMHATITDDALSPYDTKYKSACCAQMVHGHPCKACTLDWHCITLTCMLVVEQSAVHET